MAIYISIYAYIDCLKWIQKTNKNLHWDMCIEYQTQCLLFHTQLVRRRWVDLGKPKVYSKLKNQKKQCSSHWCILGLLVLCRPHKKSVSFSLLGTIFPRSSFLVWCKTGFLLRGQRPLKVRSERETKHHQINRTGEIPAKDSIANHWNYRCKLHRLLIHIIYWPCSCQHTLL